MATLSETQTIPMDLNMTDQMILDRFRKTLRLIAVEKGLAKACSNVMVLNDKIKAITERFSKAQGQNAWRYQYRVRLAITEGVRNMFYEYARFQAEEIVILRKELYNQNVEIVNGRDNIPDTENNDTDDDEENADDDVANYSDVMDAYNLRVGAESFN